MENEMPGFSSDQWALILGGSSGFGLAAATKLGAAGMSICIVHRDRRKAMPRINEAFDEIRGHGGNFMSLNLDGLSEAGREETIEALREKMGGEGRVRLLLHSIANGNLRPLAPVPAPPGEGGAPPSATDEDFAFTIYAMGTSLFSWVSSLHGAGLFASDARVVGLTSEGSQRALHGYGVVSAAKATLESVSRGIAMEFAPHGIRANIIQAGVTDTPALQAIPGHEEMRDDALRRNPLKRLTRPEDVADVIYLLATDEAAWINGALIHADGGEHLR
jgi:enoyl-[acyl-carrier protein] reductase III